MADWVKFVEKIQPFEADFGIFINSFIY